MLQSNQPYQRVDDGIGAGLIGGAVVGGAMAGGVHAGGMKGIDKLRERNSEKVEKAFSGVEKAIDSGNDAEFAKADKEHMKYNERTNKLRKAGEHHSKAFGGWKGRAASYGGSMLAGAVLGGIGDSII